MSYSASGTDVYTFTARDSGTVRFFSTWYDKDPMGRVYINGTLKVDDDDGHGSLNFDCGTIRFNAGDSVRLTLTYRAWKRTLSDVEDELRKL